MVAIYRTIDGGQTWLSSNLAAPEITHGSPSVPIDLHFADARHGWLDVYGGSMHAAVSALFATIDGGQTWTRLASPGAVSGILGFTSATLGWATGEMSGGAVLVPTSPGVNRPELLYVTRDGGQTWHFQPLPLPAGEDSNLIAQPLGPPQFSSDREGIFPVLLHATTRRPTEAIEVYVSHDAGQTWSAGPPFLLANPDSGAAATFVGGRYGRVFDGAELASTDNGGETWTTFTTIGLRPDAPGRDVEQLDLVDRLVGWALVIAPHDPTTTTVLATSDGGHNWRAIADSSTS